MVVLSQVQSSISTKIFGGLGSSVTRAPFTSQTTDKWGDASITYGSGAAITAIPYNLIADAEDFQPFGDLQTGEMVMAFKQDQALGVNDKITFDSADYLIKRIEKFPLKDGFLLKLALLAEDKS